ncbi:MAG TPA: hypothetical protein VFL79_16240 [Terriglobia bacterium]|nr:hypothetical protein [Terriglobia bacterium]
MWPLIKKMPAAWQPACTAMPEAAGLVSDWTRPGLAAIIDLTYSEAVGVRQQGCRLSRVRLLPPLKKEKAAGGPAAVQGGSWRYRIPGRAF